MAKVKAPQFHDEEHLVPKVDDEGREIVKVVADNEQGFRYAHADDLDEDDKIVDESAPGWGDKPAKPAKGN